MAYILYTNPIYKITEDYKIIDNLGNIINENNNKDITLEYKFYY